MVDEQAFADLGAGMDLDAREEAGNRGNEACRDEPLMLVEEVGQAMARWHEGRNSRARLPACSWRLDRGP